jgi:hypothetical protein
MLKSTRVTAAIALAMSLGSSVLAPMAAATEQDNVRPANDFMIATDRDMSVPDRSGHLIVKREAQKVVACTSDDHFVLTYVFAQSKPSDVRYNTPAKIDAYLKTMHSAFMSASRAHSAAIFNVGSNYPISLPPKLFQRLEAASHAFNQANNTGLNWLLRAFVTSDEPFKPCINSRLKNLTPTNK